MRSISLSFRRIRFRKYIGTKNMSIKINVIAMNTISPCSASVAAATSIAPLMKSRTARHIGKSGPLTILYRLVQRCMLDR